MRKSIKFRLTLWYSVFVFFILLTVIVIVTVVLRINSEDTIKEKLKSSVEAVSNEIHVKRGTNLRILLKNSVNGQYISIYGSDGTLLAGVEPSYESASQREFRDEDFQTRIVHSRLYYIYDKKIYNTDSYIWIRGCVQGLSQPELYIFLRNFAVIAVFIILAAMLIGGWFLTGRALKPLKTMSGDAARISGGDNLEKRLNIENSDDEIKMLGNTINEMLERVQNSFLIEKQFVSDASHELRTPIAVIRAQCEALREDEGEYTISEYIDGIEVIERQSARLNRLVEDLLMLSRLDTKNIKKKMSNFNLSELSEEILNDQKLLHDDAVYEADIAENINMIGNEDLISRAIINLMDNAYKYGDGSIRLELSMNGSEIRLAVSNNGIEISDGDKEKIWRRFYQADESRTDNTGFGLGLSMVKSIVEYHNGKIVLETKKGEGNKFILIF